MYLGKCIVVIICSQNEFNDTNATNLWSIGKGGGRGVNEKLKIYLVGVNI